MKIGKTEVEKTSQKFLDKKMNYLSNKLGFLGIDNNFKFKEKAIVIPFGLEKTVSYGGGTKNGPKEIIKASHQVELYDEELNCCLLYTSPSPRDYAASRMPSSA